jgi:hypothetical protein
MMRKGGPYSDRIDEPRNERQTTWHMVKTTGEDARGIEVTGRAEAKEEHGEAVVERTFARVVAYELATPQGPSRGFSPRRWATQ